MRLPPGDCQTLKADANEALHLIGEQKFVDVPFGLPCAARTGELTAVDLIILIDSSDSMQDEAVSLLQQLQKIVAEVQETCLGQLRIVWLGIEGIWEDTAVHQTCREYLTQLGIASSQLTSRQRGTVKTQGAQEDGARAIHDLANHFDWRTAAWRTIFYLGDEPFEGGLPYNSADIRAANEAILTARRQDVRLFCYAGTGNGTAVFDDVVARSYKRLTDATDGKTYTAPKVSLQQFGDDLATILCGVPKRGGGTVAPPDVVPCFSLNWGDSGSDHIETEDYEIMTLVARNPYRNLTFLNVTVTSLRLRYLHEGTAVNVPRAEYTGAPLADLTPSHMIRFGTLAPFESDDEAMVSRELVLGTFRTAPGAYQIEISYGFTVKFEQLYQDNATLTFGVS